MRKVIITSGLLVLILFVGYYIKKALFNFRPTIDKVKVERKNVSKNNKPKNGDSIFGQSASIDNPGSILLSFKSKNPSEVVKNCKFPFELMVGSTIDKTYESESDLNKALKVLFNESYFDELLKGRIIKNNKTKILIESKTFNKDGELESESTLAFNFRKIGGKYKLTSIILAG